MPRRFPVDIALHDNLHGPCGPVSPVSIRLPFMPRPRDPRPRKASGPPATPARPRAKAAAEPIRPRTLAKPAGPLTPAQKRHLRGFAHDLKPVVLVGQKGVTAALLDELRGALAHHELIKVKLADGERESRADSIEKIRAGSGAELVQAIGRVACFYRRNPDRAQFTLPK
jgi:RNA-binding protein